MSRFGNLEFESSHEGESHECDSAHGEAYYIASAIKAFESAEFEKSLRWFAKVLEFNPQSSAAWVGQVRSLIELGEFREAVLWADKALERFPQEPELFAAKGVAQGRDGKLEEAIALSDTSIEERGDTPYIWLARADVLLARKEARADYCFDKALAIAPGDWVVPWLAARIRHYYKQITVAVKLLQIALERNTTHFLLWLELGNCQLALGMTGLAERSFNEARQLNPDCFEARLALSRVAATGFWSRVCGVWRQIFER